MRVAIQVASSSMEYSFGPPVQQQKAMLALVLMLLTGCSAAASAAGSSSETCPSLECVTLASRLTSLMNQSADPCEDFYNYACGNFPRLVSYNPQKVKWNHDYDEWLYEDTATQMQDKVESNLYEMLVLDSLAVDADPDIQDLYNLTSQFYRSCTRWIKRSDSDDRAKQQTMSVSFMKDIYNHLMESLHPAGSGRKKTLEAVLADMLRSGGTSLITVKVPAMFPLEAMKNNTNLTALSRGSVFMPSTTFSVDNAVKYQKYVDYLTVNNITASLSLQNFNQTLAEISKGVDDAKFAAHITRSGSRGERCGIEYVHARNSLAELDAQIRCVYPTNPFSWTLLFQELLQSPVSPGTIIDGLLMARTTFILSYFKNQSVYSADGDKFSEHVSYLIFNWLMSFGDFLPEDLRQDWRKENHETNVFNYAPIRSNSGKMYDCMHWTKSYMQPIVARMYRFAHHPQPFTDVNDLISLVKNASIESIRQQSWIRPSGREAILNKLAWIQHSTGLYELTNEQLKMMYRTTLDAFRSVKVSTGALELKFGRLMSIVHCAKDRLSLYIMADKLPVNAFVYTDSLDVSVYNHLSSNWMTFPMAVLQPPVYHPSYPAFVKLGSLGFIIGHQIGHAFDSDGHELNHFGDEGHFWDDATEAAYLERMECVRSCYGNYTLYPGGPKSDSKTTLGNDISDIIGLKAAFGALQMLKRSRIGSMPSLPNLPTNLNQDQLFFVQAAQGLCAKAEPKLLVAKIGRFAYSANHVRVNGMMQNSLEFATTFQCRPGQGMHPRRQKCNFW